MNELDCVLEIEDKKKVEEPKRYNLILHNDDSTPFDFVVDVLVIFLHIPVEQAGEIAFHAHEGGRSVCGQYTRELAEAIVHNISQYCQTERHPLLVIMESEKCRN